MKARNILSFFLVFLIVLGVFLLNMTYSGSIEGSKLQLARIVLIVVFFAGVIFFRIRGQKNALGLSLTLMIVNMAFFLVSFFTVELWDLNLQTAKGIALAKLSDSFFICLVLLASFFVAGYRLKDMYLVKGRLVPGLIIGLSTFFLMGFLALLSLDKPIPSEFLVKNIIWILVFIFSNAFMEELLFRGIFLKPLGKFMKPIWAILLTSLVFASAHLQVTYTPDVLFFAGITLILGLIWGFLMHYTKSIFASVLFHAGADLMIIMPIYATFGVNG